MVNSKTNKTKRREIIPALLIALSALFESINLKKKKKSFNKGIAFSLEIYGNHNQKEIRRVAGLGNWNFSQSQLQKL